MTNPTQALQEALIAFLRLHARDAPSEVASLYAGLGCDCGRCHAGREALRASGWRWKAPTGAERALLPLCVRPQDVEHARAECERLGLVEAGR